MIDPFLIGRFRPALVRWPGGTYTIAWNRAAYWRDKERGGIRHGYATP